MPPLTHPLTRRFHVGDLLAVVTGEEGLSPRGVPGVQALLAHMTRYAPFAAEDVDRVHDAFRAALLAAYPELGAFTADDVPPPELLPLWRRRRERELGCYLAVPVLPASHPLRAPSRPRGDE